MCSVFPNEAAKLVAPTLCQCPSVGVVAGPLRRNVGSLVCTERADGKNSGMNTSLKNAILIAAILIVVICFAIGTWMLRSWN